MSRFLLKTYVDKELYDEMVRLAAAEDRTIAAEIRRACRAYVLRERQESGPYFGPVAQTIGAAVGLRKAIAVMDAETSMEKSLKDTNSAPGVMERLADPRIVQPIEVVGWPTFETDTGVSSHQ